MKILLLNTCGAEGSLALADTTLGEPVVLLMRMPGRTASERLIVLLREAMGEIGWKPRALAAIAVVTGPGSFTGVRVGLSVAKGLSEASGVPLICGVSVGAAGCCGLTWDRAEHARCLMPDAMNFIAVSLKDSRCWLSVCFRERMRWKRGLRLRRWSACEAAVWEKAGSSASVANDR